MKTTFTLLEKNLTFLIGARTSDQRTYLLDLNLDRVKRPVSSVKGWTRRTIIATLDVPCPKEGKRKCAIFKARLRKRTLKMLSGK